MGSEYNFQLIKIVKFVLLWFDGVVGNRQKGFVQYLALIIFGIVSIGVFIALKEVQRTQVFRSRAQNEVTVVEGTPRPSFAPAGIPNRGDGSIVLFDVNITDPIPSTIYRNQVLIVGIDKFDPSLYKSPRICLIQDEAKFNTNIVNPCIVENDVEKFANDAAVVKYGSKFELGFNVEPGDYFLLFTDTGLDGRVVLDKLKITILGR